MYCNRIIFIFVLSVFSNIYNINCGCFCNSCKGNTTSSNGEGIKKIIIKVTADSINIDGKILNKLEGDSKPKNIIYYSYFNYTNIYNVDDVDFNNNYETVIKDDSIKNKHYIIAFVEVQKNIKELVRYIISCTNNEIKGLFFKCKTIKKILLLKSENVTNMSIMFSGCSSLEELKLSSFNTNNVTDMSFMFYECSSLKKLNLSNFNTNNVTNMSYMFYGCSSLKELNLNNFDTSKVTNMSNMFYGCSSLKELNLSSFNTDNVTNMNSMFSRCSSLEELNISNFKTSKVTNMYGMFIGCSSLKELNLNNFDTNKVTNMYNMFAECENLEGKVTTNDKNINNMYGQFIKNANK